MSGIELKPIKDSSRTNILLPLGKTNIGRGSFFGIGDKRVSRNHAILDIEDGKIKVMPIHTNPTFFRSSSGVRLTLPKDEWHELKHGDHISLTPDEHIFEVVIDERPIVQATQSPRIPHGDVSPLKQPSPVKPPAVCQKNGIHDSKKENGQDSDDEDSSSIENENREEKKPTAKDLKEAEKEEKDDVQTEVSKSSIQKEENRQAVVLDEEDNEVALPVQRERKLPAWMLNVPKSSPQPGSAKPSKEQVGSVKSSKEQPAVAKASKKEQDVETSQKRGRGRPKGNVKKSPSKPQRRAREYDDEDDDGDDISDDEPAPKRGKTSRSQRGSTKVASYAVDDYDDLDEEWVASDMDDDGSDWEMDSQSQSNKKGKGKKRAGGTPKGKSSRPQRRGRPKKYTHTSEEDEDWSEEEVYVPRPTKRRASSSSNSQPAGQGNRPTKRAVRDHDLSEEEEDLPRQNKRTSANKEKAAKARDHSISDDEQDEKEEKSVKKKKLKSCQFGKRCYRKNPVHFKEFCHPGDPDYNSNPSEDEDTAADGLRKYADRRKQIKHAQSPGRPKRAATAKGKKKGVIAGDSDDGGPNTYDYDDSFLNDEESESASAAEDSDWNSG